eukprot:TRINITY_DN74418_c0_g1_i1.p1 TRINITY_DN74418_c0_g1~~TRINITY_DN74418_c0_g1_i1.p1  ORF type:complete len:278 (-),score=48.75 TRINITY_DN74418_c0_g1_i1:508-1341(-)
MMSMSLLVSSLTVTAAKVNVLVFGDSFGDTGPTYKVLQDMFDMHGIDADVQSSAIGGTAACQWAMQDGGMEMVEQTQKLFPDVVNGPDYVWYTMGANDQWQDGDFQSCLKSKKGKSYEEALECSRAESDHIMECTTKMLDNFWQAYPNAKVLQTGYDIPCENLLCKDTFDRFFYSAYCGNNVTCANHMGYDFQTHHMAQLQQKYADKPYNSRSFIGAAQVAAGVTGAAVGSPVWDKGAKCSYTTMCVHPKYGSPAGDAWRDAFWDLFFSQEFAAALV